VDNITHTLFAATLAQTGIRRLGSGTTAALLLASNAPDIDIVTAFDGGANYLAMHRGPTHGPLGLVALGAAVAAMVRLADTRAHLGRLLIAAWIGVTLHVAMDVPTSYGTRLLSPFSQVWYGFDWFPIIDVYLLALLMAGLVGMMVARRHRGRLAIAVLTCMASYYGFRAAMHTLALDAATARLATSATVCADRGLARWAPPGAGDADPFTPPSAEACVSLVALPTFESPFSWRVVERRQDAYLIVDQGADGRVRDSGTVPIDTGPLAMRARTAPVVQRFLNCARLPAARVESAPEGGAIVRFWDVRFTAGPLARLRGASDPSGPFGVVVKIDDK
jgi:membrane-bound metal-dependent hydrolase YbcI (DUF457 family)